MRQQIHLVKLRVSIARLAQYLRPEGMPGCLPYAGKSYKELLELAKTQERGWNTLIGACIDALRGRTMKKTHYRVVLDVLVEVYLEGVKTGRSRRKA